jgi:hypothetical protein
MNPCWDPFCVFTWLCYMAQAWEIQILNDKFLSCLDVGLMYEFTCDRKIKRQDMLVFFILFLILDKKRKSGNPVILTSLTALGLYLTRYYEKVYNEHITFPHMCHFVRCDLHCSFVVDSTSCT